MIESGKARRRAWSPQEDMIMIAEVVRHGDKDWRMIAEKVPGRSPRMCHDRYENHLRPGLMETEWSREEDNKLLELVDRCGPRFKRIAEHFPSRSLCSIKNRYYYYMTKMGLTPCMQLAEEAKGDEPLPVVAPSPTEPKVTSTRTPELPEVEWFGPGDYGFGDFSFEMGGLFFDD
jgi:hypothetical protein